ncbi:hypothetical protein IWQ56_004687, partial [Coemansia nantahalensis]
MAARLAALVSRVDDAQFLIASELIIKCTLLIAPQPATSVDQTLGTLKGRVLSFLDNGDYIGHMPTLFAVMRAMVALLDASAGRQSLRDDEDIPRFVAWLDADAQQGRIDPFIEVEFARSVLGPWSRGERASLAAALSTLDRSPTEMLLHSAQASMSFVSRIVAEGQLARQGLALSYLQPSGALVYTEAPELAADEALVLATRDFGLALLICSSGSLVPGALCILLRQLDPQSSCPPPVRRLCHRLLASIADLSGFASAAELVSTCAPDIINLDPEMYNTLGRIQHQHHQSRPVLEDDCRWRVCAALEWMLRGDFARAREMLPSADGAAGGDEWMCWLDANLLAVCADDAEFRARLGEGALEPHYPVARLAAAGEAAPGWTERVLLHLFLLYRPEQRVSDELSSTLSVFYSSDRAMPVTAAFVDGFRQDPQLQQLPLALPQWGRRFSARQICAAIDALLVERHASDTSSFLTGPRVAWLALHIEARLRAACDDDQRQRLAGSL